MGTASGVMEEVVLNARQTMILSCAEYKYYLCTGGIYNSKLYFGALDVTKALNFVS